MPSPKPDVLTQVTRLLAATDKTRAQLAAALASRGYEQKEVDHALERAAALGYLDDTRVARRRAQADLKAGWAGEALLARLVQAGLEDQTARAAVQAEIVESGWNAASAAQALVKARKLSGLKGARFLASRGFEEDLVERVIGTGEFDR